MIPRTRSHHDIASSSSSGSYHHYHQSSSSSSDMRDWRAAISTPLTYRIGNSTLHFRTHQLLIYSVILCSIFVLFYIIVTGGETRVSGGSVVSGQGETIFSGHALCPNVSYPGHMVSSRAGTQYRISVISDLDTGSKLDNGQWVSYLMSAGLELARDQHGVTVTWDSVGEVALTSNIAAGGRGMELSELTVFNGRLVTLDDRTGIVYSVVDGEHVVPWVILSDGDGTKTKGFKAEWSTVKDDKLVVGGLGKEWTTQTGDIVNHDPMWVKEISCDGAVEHLDWRAHYLAVRESVGISWPGYMIHEAVCWSSARRQWTFLPRRMSKDKYDDVKDERMGANVMIIADEHFTKIRTVTVGVRNPTHGFSSCKFIPGTDDKLIIALKSEEVEGTAATYMMVFNIEGEVIYDEVKIGDRKFEGIEFI